jgi:hypothetical protein
MSLAAVLAFAVQGRGDAVSPRQISSKSVRKYDYQLQLDDLSSGTHRGRLYSANLRYEVLVINTVT